MHAWSKSAIGACGRNSSSLRNRSVATKLSWDLRAEQFITVTGFSEGQSQVDIGGHIHNKLHENWGWIVGSVAQNGCNFLATS